MKINKRVGWIALCAMCTGAWAQSTPIAIKDAKIEIGNGSKLAKASIVLQDGKIVAIGENIVLPGSAQVIDGTGMTVYPGFIDAYSTRGLKLPDAPAAGTPPDSRNTAPPAMWHENRKGIRSDVVAAKCLDLKDQLESNYKQGITTALLAPGTGSVRGTACIVDYTATGNVLNPAAGEEMSFRGGGGGGGGGYPGSLLGVIALLRQVLADAKTYNDSIGMVTNEGFANMKPLMSGSMPGIFVADTDREIYRAQSISEEFGIKPVIASGREAYKQADALKAKAISVFVTVDPGEAPTKAVSPNGAPQAVLDERYSNWEERSKNVQILSKTGVLFGLATAGSSLSDYLTNVRSLVKNGLSHDEALQGMTSNCAKALGIADKVGTLEVGKLANVVIMTGDFDQSGSEVKSVFVEGTQIDVKKEAGK